MFFVIRLFCNYSVRNCSTRQYFADLKKFYRSTTFELFMTSESDESTRRTCFVFDKDESTKILIQMVYEIPSSKIRRKLNLLRSVEESLSQTIRRLTSNIESATKKEKKLKKRRQKEPIDVQCEAEESIVIKVLNSDNEPIDENKKNKDVWPNARQLLINEETYEIEHNAPAIIKFRFPDVIMTNTISTALVDLDYGDWEHSIFDWFVADEINDETQWIHVHRGPFCVFRDEHVKKFVRLQCFPRNNSFRQGMSGDHQSKRAIIPCPVDLPMNKRHELTFNFLPIDSDDVRFVCYNILANGYASSTDAAELIYSYCPQQYLEHDYRKLLLLREILGYHSDIISLQECDKRFYERELTYVMKQNGFKGQMKMKSENVGEGEVIFYRTDRFNFIDNHDVTLSEYLTDSQETDFLRQRFSKVPEIYANLLQRNTALQIVALQRNGKSNEILLICNTHLYFHPQADIIRCSQVMVGLQRIKQIKQLYEKQNKTVSIIWNGDFNANVTSLAFHLLFNGVLLTDPKHRSYNQIYETLITDFEYKTPIELNIYSEYKYTNYMLNFHDVIDHIFFEKNKFQFQRSIPMITHDEVTQFKALPSCQIPSDHLALVVELKMIQ